MWSSIDDLCAKVIDIIKDKAKTGKIFIRPLDEAIRIRTGETGLNAV
jgi:nitrogen regulatory protein P-II 1